MSTTIVRIRTSLPPTYHQGRISKLSFLRYMATKKLGVAPSVFYKINARFKDLDADKSGSLDKMDVLRFGVKIGGA